MSSDIRSMIALLLAAQLTNYMLPEQPVCRNLDASREHEAIFDELGREAQLEWVRESEDCFLSAGGEELERIDLEDFFIIRDVPIDNPDGIELYDEELLDFYWVVGVDGDFLGYVLEGSFVWRLDP